MPRQTVIEALSEWHRAESERVEARLDAREATKTHPCLRRGTKDWLSCDAERVPESQLCSNCRVTSPLWRQYRTLHALERRLRYKISRRIVYAAQKRRQEAQNER